MSRIYKVITPSGYRLVEATTKGQAISHCVSTDYSAEPISSSDLYAAMQAGAQVEKVAVAAKKSDTPEPLQQPSPAGSSVAVHNNPPTLMHSSTPPIQSMPQASTGAQAPSGETAQQGQLNAPQPTVATPPIASAAPAVDMGNAAPPAMNTGGVDASTKLPAFLAKGNAVQGQQAPAAAADGRWTPPAPAQVANQANGGAGLNPNPVIAEQQRINPEAAAAAGAPAPIIPIARAHALPPAAPAGQEEWADRAVKPNQS